MHATHAVILAVERWIGTFYKTSGLVGHSESDIRHEIFISMKMDRMVGPLPSAGFVFDMFCCGHSTENVNSIMMILILT